MPYRDPTSDLPITGFRQILDEPNLDLESIVESPNGGRFFAPLGTFNRLVDAVAIQTAIDDTFIVPELT